MESDLVFRLDAVGPFVRFLKNGVHLRPGAGYSRTGIPLRPGAGNIRTDTNNFRIAPNKNDRNINYDDDDDDVDDVSINFAGVGPATFTAADIKSGAVRIESVDGVEVTKDYAVITVTDGVHFVTKREEICIKSVNDQRPVAAAPSEWKGEDGEIHSSGKVTFVTEGKHMFKTEPLSGSRGS